MKPCLRIVVLSVWVVGAFCASAATLTTEDVVKMMWARLNDDVIIQTIQATGSQFYLTPQEIKRLKAQGVSNRVLAVMQNGGRQTDTAKQVQSTGEVTGRSYESVTTDTVIRGIYVAPPTSGTYYYTQRRKFMRMNGRIR